jgi:hypothetical protein
MKIGVADSGSDGSGVNRGNHCDDSHTGDGDSCVHRLPVSTCR